MFTQRETPAASTPRPPVVFKEFYKLSTDRSNRNLTRVKNRDKRNNVTGLPMGMDPKSTTHQNNVLPLGYVFKSDSNIKYVVK